MTAPNIFIRRETEPGKQPSIIKVTAVDGAYAYTASLTEPGKSYPMPIEDYDTKFLKSWRVATDEDLGILGSPDETFRAPANADEFDQPEPVSPSLVPTPEGGFRPPAEAEVPPPIGSGPRTNLDVDNTRMPKTRAGKEKTSA